jgi:hypothetical protein
LKRSNEPPLFRDLRVPLLDPADVQDLTSTKFDETRFRLRFIPEEQPLAVDAIDRGWLI